MSRQIMLRRTDHPAPDGLPPPEVKVVTAFRVSCDGGEGALGHPRVWLTIPREQGYVDCGYCDARFIHKEYVDGTTATAVHHSTRADRITGADQRGDVLGKQPGDGTDGVHRGNDGAAGQTHSE